MRNMYLLIIVTAICTALFLRGAEYVTRELRYGYLFARCEPFRLPVPHNNTWETRIIGKHCRPRFAAHDVIERVIVKPEYMEIYRKYQLRQFDELFPAPTLELPKRPI